MSFNTLLRSRWTNANTMLCVGIDPDPHRIPAHLPRNDALFQFCRVVVDATADYACAFKPQFAHFAAQGAEEVLEELIDYIHNAHPGIPVILDAKRGDIGSTAEYYAREAFERYRADAVTVNPYLGADSVKPYADHADKGVIILCRTSNAGGSDLQFLDCGGQPLYQHVARLVAGKWNANGNCGLVVGATFPAELAKVREIVGDMPLLIPGIGAQGGDVIATVRAGRTAVGTGMIISSSRAILYAGKGEDFGAAARIAAKATRDAINDANT